VTLPRGRQLEHEGFTSALLQVLPDSLIVLDGSRLVDELSVINDAVRELLHTFLVEFH
jgi:hypothetical protein